MEQQPFGCLCGTKERSTVATRTYFSDTLSEDATFEMVSKNIELHTLSKHNFTRGYIAGISAYYSNAP